MNSSLKISKIKTSQIAGVAMVAAAAMVSAIATPELASATSVVGYNFDPADGLGPGISIGDRTIGVGFTVGINRFLVSALGVYDNDGDGLGINRTVSLWTETGTLLSSAIVPAPPNDTSTFLDAATNFRFITLPTPVMLAPNTTYRVAVYYPDNPDTDRLLISSDYVFPSEPAISFIDPSGYISASTFNPLTFPANSTGSVFRATGNVYGTEVPEPSALGGLLAIGFFLGIKAIKKR